MTALLYYSISSDLTEDKLIEIDNQVANKRETVCIFVRSLAANGKDKTKRVILIIIFVPVFWFSDVQSSEAIGFPMPPTPVVRVQPRVEHSYKKLDVAKLVYRKPDHISFNCKYFYQSKEEILFLLYATDPKLSSNQQVLKFITDLRGGNWSSAIFLGIIILILAQGTGFVGHDHNRGWGLNRQNPFQPPTVEHRYPPVYDLFSPRRTPDCTRPGSTLQINRPTAMPHGEFVGLTKEERRALPHSNDMKIIHKGRPELEVGFWQSKFKVPDHGAVHDLPYTVKANGGTKTEKTDENTLKMIRSIVDMPNRDNVQWFNGTYQGGTDREFEAIHIYDLDKQVIAVFKKATGKFVTTCQLSDPEHDELINTGNFGGGEGWFSGQVRNLPPQQTAVNTFESDVTKITPINPIDENSSTNTDFIPTNSFESDVMGITPIDNSQLDNQ